MAARTLSDAIAQYGSDAYLLSIGKSGPHTSNVTIEFRDGVISCLVSKTTAANIAKDSNVSLFWPPLEPGGYAMIVNGTATGDMQATGVRLHIKLTKSVFHRPGPKPAGGDGPCSSDCRQIIRE